MALRVVLLKPRRHAVDGCLDRYRRGIIPRSTLPPIFGVGAAEGRGPEAGGP